MASSTWNWMAFVKYNACLTWCLKRQINTCIHIYVYIYIYIYICMYVYVYIPFYYCIVLYNFLIIYNYLRRFACRFFCDLSHIWLFIVLICWFVSSPLVAFLMSLWMHIVPTDPSGSASLTNASNYIIDWLGTGIHTSNVEMQVRYLAKLTFCMARFRLYSFGCGGIRNLTWKYLGNASANQNA